MFIDSSTCAGAAVDGDPAGGAQRAAGHGGQLPVRGVGRGAALPDRQEAELPHCCG